MTVRMTNCPKFEKCSAPICPLDPDWKKRVMGKDDRVCFYLREAVKEGAQTRFLGGTTEEIYQKAVNLLPAIFVHADTLRKRLVRSQKTGSKLERFTKKRTEIETPSDGVRFTKTTWLCKSQTSPFTGSVTRP